MSALVQLRGVSMVYPSLQGESVIALSEINLEIAEEEFVSLIGPSGCGKSTTLSIMAGLLAPTSGSILIGGHDPVRARQNRELGVVFQDAVLLPWKTVRQNAAFLVEIAGRLSPQAWQMVDDLLGMVGLSDFRNHYPHQLSGGMRQRLSIARALCLEPLLLLMDEPFGALDEFTRHRMNVELLHIRAKTRKTIVFVTHNIAEAVFMSDRVIAMSPRPGRIVEDLKIDLGRPRDKEVRYTPQFNEYVVHLQKLLEDGEGH